MTKRMLIDATHAEETRVVVLDGSRIEDFDVETSAKKQLKGNIYLAKVVRVEPSLQAAFVEYGGGRHGFLAFGEIHPDYYQIPVADRQRLLAMQAEEARAEADAEEAALDPRANRAEAATQVAPSQAPSEASSNAPSEEPAPIVPTEADGPPGGELGDTPAQRELDIAPAERTEEELPADAAAPPVPGADTAPDATMDEPDDRDGRPAQASIIARDERFGPGDMELAPPAEPGSQDVDEPEADDASDDPSEVLATLSDPAIFADLEVPAEAEPPPETVGGDPEAGEGAEEARRRRESRFLRQYRIQEVIKRRQIMLIQVVKEERGTKGAALTTYISLAGRFSVLMPNSPRGGGISRKITSAADRRRLKEVTAELDLPQGMGLIVRTAGANRPKPEIKRDCEYLMRLWDDIREHTLRSTAPALIYEEASLIKRAIRDVYSRDIDEIVVDGEEGWRAAHEFMRMLMPSHAKKVQLWRGPDGTGSGQPLFAKHAVEAQLDAMLSPTVQLKSGGYLVINQAEALVAIDVNSGRSTRERNIEETALRTNLEAADEAARQLRLRDLAGLIVIDFIDMESRRNNAAVERRLKDALKVDRARIQVGTISHFGLLEMSRQRLRPSVTETSFMACPHCNGTGHVRSTESAAIHVLREIEDEAARGRSAVVMVHAASSVVMFLLNHKRDRLGEIEARSFMRVQFAMDESLTPPACRIDRVRARNPDERPPAPPPVAPAAPMPATADEEEDLAFDPEPDDDLPDAAAPAEAEASRTPASAPPGTVADQTEEGRRRRRRRRRGGRREDGDKADVSLGSEGETESEAADELASAPETPVPESSVGPTMLDAAPLAEPQGAPAAEGPAEPGTAEGETRNRRRGRRGGRRRRREDGTEIPDGPDPALAEPVPFVATYTGPTPADPFGGSGYDFFDLMDEEPEPAPRVARAPEPTPMPDDAPAAESPPETTPAVGPDIVFDPPLMAPDPVATAPVREEVPNSPPETTPAVGPDIVFDPPLMAPDPVASAPVPEDAREAPPETTPAVAPDIVFDPPLTAAPEAVTPEPVAPQPVALEPVALQPVAPQPVAPQPVAPEPVAPEPVASQPVVHGPDAQATEPLVGPLVQPVLIGEAAPGERRKGWWRR